MPNRFHEKVRETLYKFLAARDGEQCLHCKSRPAREGPPLEIDHADDDPTNWEPENLHLLCNACNLQFRQLSTEEHIRQIQIDSAQNVNVRERFQGKPSTELSKLLVDYTQGSAEMQANNYHEKKFRNWILKEIDKVGFITKEDCLNSGAEYCGCSQITIGRYLAKLTSSMGVLEARKSELNQVIICRRQGKNGERGLI